MKKQVQRHKETCSRGRTPGESRARVISVTLCCFFIDISCPEIPLYSGEGRPIIREGLLPAPTSLIILYRPLVELCCLCIVTRGRGHSAGWATWPGFLTPQEAIGIRVHRVVVKIKEGDV